MVRKFPGKSSRKYGNCCISEKRTIQPKIPAGGANEAKVDQTTEMYFLLSGPFIRESSDTWKIVTTKYAVGTEYYICRIQLFE